MLDNNDFIELDDLLREARKVFEDDLLASAPLYLQALNIAERQDNQLKIFYIRLKLSIIYTFSYEPRKSIAEMLWLLNNATDEILKSSVIGSPIRRLFLLTLQNIGDYRFASVPLSKIIELREYVKQIYLRCNEGLRRFYYGQLKTIINGVPLCEIDESYNNWISTTSTQYGDLYDECEVCEKDLEISYLVYKADYESALLKMEALIESNETCYLVPRITYVTMLIPLVKMGKIKLADLYHKRSYSKVASSEGFTDEISIHIIYMCFRNYEKALSMFNENMKVFQAVQSDYSKLEYYTCAFALFQTLEKNDKSDIHIKLDKSYEIYNPSGIYNVKTLKDYYKDKMDLIKNAFDKRNGNNEVSRLIENKLEILKL